MAEIIWHSNIDVYRCCGCGRDYIPQKRSRYCVDCNDSLTAAQRYQALLAKLPPQHASERRGDANEKYRRILEKGDGLFCSNPMCGKTKDLEIHHINPIGKMGPDKMWNLICLCHDCHRNQKLHREHPLKANVFKAFVWKCLHEKKILGKFIDDGDVPQDWT